MKESTVVSIMWDQSKDFEIFLYAQLNYHEHGWVRYASDEYYVYILDLDGEQKTMITLSYPGSKLRLQAAEYRR